MQALIASGNVQAVETTSALRYRFRIDKSPIGSPKILHKSFFYGMLVDEANGHPNPSSQIGIVGLASEVRMTITDYHVVRYISERKEDTDPLCSNQGQASLPLVVLT